MTVNQEPAKNKSMSERIMNLIGAAKRHPVISILVSILLAIAWASDAIPWLTGSQDLPTLWRKYYQTPTPSPTVMPPTPTITDNKPTPNKLTTPATSPSLTPDVIWAKVICNPTVVTLKKPIAQRVTPVQQSNEVASLKNITMWAESAYVRRDTDFLTINFAYKRANNKEEGFVDVGLLRDRMYYTDNNGRAFKPLRPRAYDGIYKPMSPFYVSSNCENKESNKNPVLKDEVVRCSMGFERPSSLPAFIILHFNGWFTDMKLTLEWSKW